MIIPYWPSPARQTWKRPGFENAEHVTSSPRPVTTSNSSTLSVWVPQRKVCPPIPPTDNVPPTLSSMKSVNTGGVRDLVSVCCSRSIHLTPPSTHADPHQWIVCGGESSCRSRHRHRPVPALACCVLAHALPHEYGVPAQNEPSGRCPARTLVAAPRSGAGALYARNRRLRR